VTPSGQGCAAEYADTGEEYPSRECFIDGLRCEAEEARFGGIVIQRVRRLSISAHAADYEIYFSAEDRRHFQSGELARSWAKRFPQLFGEAELRLALNQPKYHFYEWLTAVHLFSDHGYLSLIEKYHFKSHPAAYALFQQLTSPEIVDLLSGGGPGPRTQGPDLLAFRPDRSAWFFVEVKGPRDHVRDPQAKLFHRLEQISGRPVRIAECRQQE
jgi:hypothetical protein